MIGRAVTAGVLLALLAGGMGYALGQEQAGVHHESRVSCHSAEGAISCDLDDGWTVAVPIDVTWTGDDGAYREDGRPDCLPATGLGLEPPVALDWVWVESDGVRRRQVVWVGC